MKLILCVLVLVVLCPVMVWAIEIGPLYIGEDPPPEHGYERDLSCFALMEQAMRAMEPWSMLDFEPLDQQISLEHIQRSSRGLNQLVLCHESDCAPPGHSQDIEAGRAIMLWSNAKAQCWSKP